MDINQFPLWTALVTPLDQSDNVDYESLLNLLKQQVEANLGILALGSTGEALNLTLDERKNILDFILSKDLGLPIMVGVGGINLDETSDWIDYLNKIEVDAYLLVTPLYAKPGEMGQTHWFKSLLDKSVRPCMLYNIPGRSGVSLNHNTVKTLSDHSKFWAIKEASGSLEEFKKYNAEAPKVRLFSGDDGLFYEHAKLGSCGLISVASNCWPQATKKYVSQSLSNNMKDQTLWENAADSLFLASNPVPAKALLYSNQIIKTNRTRAPLSHEDLNQLETILEFDKKINKWNEANHE